MQVRKKGQCSEEQIAANIAKLVKEGKPQEQAIAIAFEGCPQERSEQLAMLENISKNGKRSYRRVTVVDEVQGIIRGYIAVWGSPQHRDDYQTYFDKEKPPELGLDFLPIPLIYEHGFDGGVKKEIIGRVTRAWFDNIGVAFEAKLDQTVRAFTRFIAEIRSGKLSTSSATGEHLAEFDEDGRFVNWPLLELSLTANPAEALMPAVQLMRSNLTHGASGQSQGEMIASERKYNETQEVRKQMSQTRQVALEALKAALDALPPDATTEQIVQVLIGAGLSAEDFAAIVSQTELPMESRQEENGEEPVVTGEGEGDTPATADVVTALDTIKESVIVLMEEQGATEAVAELEEARSKGNKLARENAAMALQIASHRSQKQREQAMPNVPKQPRHGGGNGRITDMEDMEYAGLDSRQMGYGYQLLKASGKPISDNFLRNMAGKTLDLVGKGEGAFRNDKSYWAVRSALRNATRADELVYTTNTGYGKEWIPEMWETQAWDKVRQELVFDVITRNMMQIEATGRPGSATTVPLVDSDPEFFRAAENKHVADDLLPKPLVDSSRLGSASVDVTPIKGMARTIVTQEMIEDSIVPVLSQLDQQYTAAFAEQMEKLVINGDTESADSTNINLIDGTPAGGTSTPAYRITDGLLKYALVTGGSTYKTPGGAFTTKDFLTARYLLPNNLVSDPSKLIFLSDNNTMGTMLDQTDVKDLSVFRDPTIESGVLLNLWGTPYLQSGQMALANTAGKINGTNPTTNNIKGRILCFMPQYWAMVWKRQITFKTQEDIETDTTTVVASFRVAFRYRSAGASSCVYNLTMTV